MVKHLPAMWETCVRSLDREDPLEKEMVTHSSTLAWKIPWTEEPSRLQSMGSQSQLRQSNFTFFLSLVGDKTRITHVITVISSGGFILRTWLLLLGNMVDLGSTAGLGSLHCSQFLGLAPEQRTCLPNSASCAGLRWARWAG